VINKQDFIKGFGVIEVRKIKNFVIGDKYRNLLSLEGIDKCSSRIFGLDLKTFNECNIDRITERINNDSVDRLGFFRENFTWCEECMTYSYHSIFHQFKLLRHCPFHLKPLKQICPICQQILPFLLTDKGWNGPFSCRCGYVISESNFEKWGFSPKIVCADTQKWLNQNYSKTKKIIFDPENTFLLAEPLKLFISVDSHKSKYTEIYVSLINNVQKETYRFTKNITENINVRNSYVHGFYTQLFESTLQAFKGIDRLIKKRILKPHIHCTEDICKETDQPCGFIWAYNQWRFSLLGQDLKYRKFITVRAQARHYEFAVFGETYKKDLYKLYCLIIDSFDKEISNNESKEFEDLIQWIISGAAANYYLQGFYNWLEASKELINKKSIKLTEVKHITHKKMPIMIFECHRTQPSRIRVNFRTETSSE
jgi:hypothetical protein